MACVNITEVDTLMKVQTLTQAIRETIGTPFHHAGRVTGVGLDCGGMVVVALRSLGVEVKDNPYYDRRDGINEMVEVLKDNHFLPREKGASPQAGDLILIRGLGIDHHLVYVTEDDTIIHAWRTTGINKVVETTMLPEWYDHIHSIWRLEGLEA